MFITGPDVIKTVTGEDVTMEALGGAAVHHAISGAAHLVAPDEDAGNETVRALLAFLPSNNMEDPPRIDPLDDPDREDPDLDTFVPDLATRPYDMHRIIESILDEGDFLEIQPAFAPNILCGFGRLDGHPVGVVANQPMHLAGTLDIAASEKAARFVRTCDAFNVPLVVLEDVPGFLPGLDQEHQGIIRRGSKLLYAFAEATVPRVTVIIRKAYGGAYVVMNSKHIGADANFAWPTAEIAVMGPDAAVGLIFRRELADAEDPAARRKDLIAEYEERFASPYQAAGRGYIDDVIDPRTTRPRLIRTLALARTKRVAVPPAQARKHSAVTDSGPVPPDFIMTPEPTPEELAALAAALLPLLDGHADESDNPAAPTPAWRIAALQEGVSGIAGGPTAGWGAPRAGWRG
jgi:propionyl-CoA carboxylase beta chain